MQKHLIIVCVKILFMATMICQPHISMASVWQINIGLIYPTSGSLASLGKTALNGHQFAVDEINSYGGIHSLGGAKLKVIVGDSEGDPVAGVKEAYRLAKNNVVAFIGSYQSTVTYATTEVAEKLAIPYIVSTAIADSITKRGFKYTFRPESTLSDFVRDEFKFIKDVSENTGRFVKTVASL